MLDYLRKIKHKINETKKKKPFKITENTKKKVFKKICKSLQ